MFKSRRNGLENSVWAAIFLDEKKLDHPLIEKAFILLVNYASN